MMKFITAFLLLTNLAQAQNKTAGDLIKATDWNTSTLVIGTIQQSILSVSEFQAIQGNCWRLMNGSSLAGTDLGALKGSSMTNLPDATSDGRFLRQAKAGRALGSLENDEIKSHSHTNWFGNNPGGWAPGGYAYNGGSGATNRSGDFNTQATGGDETRPKNIAVNFFIKVNKACN